MKVRRRIHFITAQIVTCFGRPAWRKRQDGRGLSCRSRLSCGGRWFFLRRASGLFAKHRGEPGGGGWVLDALGQSLFGALAAGVLRAGGADGVAVLAGQRLGSAVVIAGGLPRLASPPLQAPEVLSLFTMSSCALCTVRGVHGRYACEACTCTRSSALTE
jgi:hypothetical protein